MIAIKKAGSSDDQRSVEKYWRQKENLIQTENKTKKIVKLKF